ncbi:hypothetical protein [Companilactobacillus futsaii]|uniref:Surface layer protein A domain-containing protein n=2 Tax=Companilactobacillus futsaii TaxID=938155 RepID=A0A5B7SW48_9LACO|nr:hypothetical protein [Companilactobacillus futsaii]KRK99389.1 hypothetical protein FC88_GL000118 [Companilactobacillus futsaii JCM 17355]QCX24176.1 hypothetical protein FG051_03220 [Companilactobacillus futsaii]
MKLVQKSLLFASLFAVGMGATTIPIVTNGNGAVQAATVVKGTTANAYFFKVGKDKFVKGEDVKILTNDNQTDEDMVSTIEANDFRLEVNVPKAQLYNKKGEKIGKCLTQGTVCKIGNQSAFYDKTYYKDFKGNISQMNNSTLVS